MGSPEKIPIAKKDVPAEQMKDITALAQSEEIYLHPLCQVLQSVILFVETEYLLEAKSVMTEKMMEKAAMMTVLEFLMDMIARMEIFLLMRVAMQSVEIQYQFPQKLVMMDKLETVQAVKVIAVASKKDGLALMMIEEIEGDF